MKALFYVLKWEATRYWLVGPFLADIPAYEWGEENADRAAPYNGWDVISLADPTAAPMVIRPDQEPEPSPISLTLWPSRGAATDTDRRVGTQSRWFGQTSNGTPITAFIAGVEIRERLPGEPVAGPYSTAEDLRRELDQKT